MCGSIFKEKMNETKKESKRGKKEQKKSEKTNKTKNKKKPKKKKKKKEISYSCSLIRCSDIGFNLRIFVLTVPSNLFSTRIDSPKKKKRIKERKKNHVKLLLSPVPAWIIDNTLVSK